MFNSFSPTLSLIVRYPLLHTSVTGTDGSRDYLHQLHEVEAEFENEARKARDLAAENRKLQRQLTEQKSQSEADRRQVTDITEQCHALQQRVRTLKRQLEEAVGYVIFVTLYNCHSLLGAHPQKCGIKLSTPTPAPS